MSKTTTAAAPEVASGAKGSSPDRKKPLLVLVGVLVLAAGWYFLLGPGAGATEPEAKEVVAGEVLALEPITMNLADGRLLKLGLALQLVAEPAEAELSGSVALDEAISFLGEHTYNQLAAPAARDKAKGELSQRVADRYHGDVLEVYFTEFVMQ